ncbi:tryptophan synthase subunit alpha [Staphylococcus sp. mip270_02]|uniref:Tryptophan synthase alpha chain n=1 Tax=Staphylococcus xylosus TaxID=1288 RepID=A0A418IKB9_STAXY|nr:MULTISPECIES: tryptophan synthase subunit alpha [Staphylococcus]MDW8542119.1 tryptophan synthase subunit alpha [Staphylococcus sp. KG4-1]MRF37857.1 tryptophan synthase subunit alpha [Staphylococcus sp. KY49P]MDW8560571.1 tryptophan synthase subunit alpha [Staphylococcus sp. KG4-3]PTI05195.1 tryptophan synthase subunit alpha [Staphylococcus xylosus]RIN07690.1 tryptophan synthase subunit alpha [Staphylococcus xylosus]
MHKLFIPYVMGNKHFIENVKTLSNVGADIIEVGVPFSDPVADGPVIMDAGNKAIQEGVNIQFILDQLTKHRDEIQSDYVLMTYYNIINYYGESEFLQACERAGVYGLIIPDLPHELVQQFKERHPQRKTQIISLIAMTTSESRSNQIAKDAEGFIYTVTMNATTGENGKFHPELKDRIKKIKDKSEVPVVAGFGIRTPEHVKDITEASDGVVIGSEIVKRFENDSEKNMLNYLKSIRNALNQ